MHQKRQLTKELGRYASSISKCSWCIWKKRRQWPLRISFMCDTIIEQLLKNCRWIIWIFSSQSSFFVQTEFSLVPFDSQGQNLQNCTRVFVTLTGTIFSNVQLALCLVAWAFESCNQRICWLAVPQNRISNIYLFCFILIFIVSLFFVHSFAQRICTNGADDFEIRRRFLYSISTNTLLTFRCLTINEIDSKPLGCGYKFMANKNRKSTS